MSATQKTKESASSVPADSEEIESVNLPFTENALTVLRKRYLRKGTAGLPIESPVEMFRRVARTVAAADADHGADTTQAEETFYDLLTEVRFFPNSPTFTGAGTPLGQLAACFVLPIEDDMGRHSGGIFSTLRNAALVQQTGGGNGFSFSRLRPKGARVDTSAGIATGPIGFLRVYDKAFGEIAQGGTRRGANMAVLRVDHPDILEFIRCKGAEGDISNFNISVGITDAFLAAVEQDSDFGLVNPQDGNVWNTVRARDIFDEIVKHAHHNGEPGVLFLDTANRSNPVPHLYELEATNPCVTGDTLIYTEDGLHRADELAAKGMQVAVTSDARFGTETFLPATHVFPTGVKPVFRLATREGYKVRLTEDHRVMTWRGWVKARDLRPGDRIHILNRKGGFGNEGTLEEGRVLGWLVGDGTVNVVRAALSFFGDEKQELAPAFAEMVTDLVDKPGRGRSYPVGVVEVRGRNEARVASERLRLWVEGFGIRKGEKHFVPSAVLTGSEEMQKGFLQALFTADGQVNNSGEKDCSVRLSASHLPLLKDVQRLLLNIGIASRIYENRRTGGYRQMPDGKGGDKAYFHRPRHDLAISKSNLIHFANEIGFLSEAKQARLANHLSNMVRGPYQEPFLATVTTLEPDGVEPVYDLHQPDTHSFIANGLVVHNCGEQFLGPYENCCLGSINLARHLTDDDRIDWEELRTTIEQGTHFLDNVVSANRYVPAVPELQEAAHRNRRIGLGFMGLGDVMYRLGVRYATDEGQELAAQIVEFIRFHAMRTSIALARERGPFPSIRGSVYDPENLLWRPPQPLRPYSRDTGRPSLDWGEITQGILRYGIRNAAQLTVAPTGTISTVAGCEAYGCEPVFALAYTRHVDDNGQNLELKYISPLFERALSRASLDAQTRESIISQVRRTGSCQNVPGVPEDIRHAFVVSQDIGPDEHVRMQAAIQAFVDNSLSKTINFPETATEEDVAKAYMLAWKLGCKGLTVYVTGSREKVVLETEATKQAKTGSLAQPLAPPLLVKPRPRRMIGATYRVLTPLGKAYVTVNQNGDNEPFEVFLNVGKAGSETAAMSEAIGRLMSLCLRLPSTLSGQERLGRIVEELRGIGGLRAIGYGPRQIRSLPDGIAQALAEHLDIPFENNGYDEQAAAQLTLFPHADLCPDCGHAALVREEGCRKCYACGYSEC